MKKKPHPKMKTFTDLVKAHAKKLKREARKAKK